MKTATHHNSIPESLVKRYLRTRCRLGVHNWVRTTEEFDDIILVKKACYLCEKRKVERVYYR